MRHRTYHLMISSSSPDLLFILHIAHAIKLSTTTPTPTAIPMMAGVEIELPPLLEEVLSAAVLADDVEVDDGVEVVNLVMTIVEPAWSVLRDRLM